MHPAPEIEELLRAYYAASAKGDAEFLARHIAPDAGTVVVGTDDGEWWEGGESIVATWGGEWRRRGGLPVHGSTARAWRQGAVAWASDRAYWTMPSGRAVPFRVTVVFELRGEAWQIVQAHFSVGVPNERLGEG
jgi:ketosteroid isomerase-like protein